MRNVILISMFSLLTVAPSAFAGEKLTLECAFVSADGGQVPSEVVLFSGMRTKVACDKYICGKDWEVTMNYNGKGYEDLIMTIENTKTGQYANTTHHDVKKGGSYDLSSMDLKARQGVSVSCDLLKAE